MSLIVGNFDDSVMSAPPRPKSETNRHDRSCVRARAQGRRQATEYVDAGISGAKDRRPALDQLMADAKRRKVDLVVCWKLDRFGRSLAHLVNAIQALTDAGVGFTSLGEGIDTRSATGRLMLGILGSFAEFERDRIRERIHAGLARARREGQRLGRRRERVNARDLERVQELSVREAATVLGVPASRIHRERSLFQNPSGDVSQIAPDSMTSDVTS
jgi:DNA invertase Pin-like site-specific DNA recombinase